MDTEQLSIFNSSIWKSKVNETYLAYVAIDNCVIHAHNGNEALEDDLESLEGALYIHSHQMITIFCTFVEVMLKDFLYTVYREIPEKIESQLPTEFSDHFNTLLSKNCLDNEAIDIFASIAAKKSFDFKINKTINIVCDLVENNNRKTKKCKDQLSETKEDLNKIFKLRNKLIHENRPPKNGINPIIKILYLNIAPKFITQLDAFCDDLNISAVKERKQKEKETLDELLRNIENLELIGHP